MRVRRVEEGFSLKICMYSILFSREGKEEGYEEVIGDFGFIAAHEV